MPHLWGSKHGVLGAAQDLMRSLGMVRGMSARGGGGGGAEACTFFFGFFSLLCFLLAAGSSSDKPGKHMACTQ